MGLLIAAIMHRADLQDRDGAPRLLATMRSTFPWLRHIFADAAYAGRKLEATLAKLGTGIFEIIRRTAAAKGFERLPRRWGGRAHRRLAKDFEATLESAQVWLFIASVKLLLRCLART